MGRVTLESLTEAINHIRGQLTTVRGSMSRMEDRLIDVEDSFNYTITPEIVHQFLKSTPINQNEYVPKGYTRLYNVDQRRQVLRIKVEICGALGFDLVLDDWVPNEQKWSKYVVDQWGTHLFPPPKVKYERQTIDRSKGEQGDNLRVEKSEVEWSEVRGLPQSQSNLFIHPSLCKNSYVGCPNIPKGVSFQGKEDLSCECQGTIAKLNTFTIANEQSVSDSLSLCEPNASLPCVDNVHVESVDTLVDPFGDRIDSYSKIDLCPPSVDTRVLNDSSLSCDNFVDQLACECSSLIDGSCDVIKEPQFGDTNDKGELGCFNSPMVVDHSLFKYNILFEDDEITPSDVPSGVDHDSSVVFDNYAFYSNLLWFEDYPPKDGNLFLEDESTLVGKDHDEKEGGELCLSECGTNEGLHMRLFKCIGSFALPLCQCFLSSQNSRTNPFQEGENDAIQIASKPFTHELQSIDGLFTRMEVLGLILVAGRDSHAWKITWRSEGRQLTTLPLWRAGGPLVRRPMTWAMTPTHPILQDQAWSRIPRQPNR
ncbi:hypothetical protein KY290_017518 [Solanum tuberosum]|uniref:Uncharacterized protein n=1 Tax=Solanum tuberosum TaxID=4113 RepID=A0ABQ7VBI2_SOLTU|nr:hypothetical protein KY290_017518 [Solanum tuberosum]